MEWMFIVPSAVSTSCGQLPEKGFLVPQFDIDFQKCYVCQQKIKQITVEEQLHQLSESVCNNSVQVKSSVGIYRKQKIV
jgi:hypothetical protein